MSDTEVSPTTIGKNTYYVKATDTDNTTPTSCSGISEITIQVNPLPNLIVNDVTIVLESVDLNSAIGTTTSNTFVIVKRETNAYQE